MCMRMHVCMCGLLHCMNDVATLWNLTLFIYKFCTRLIVMFCLFVNALYDWNVTKIIPVYIEMPLANKYPCIPVTYPRL